jgi:SAM-dependent methyltransferase
MAPDVWAAGDAYETYVGRWSRSVAERFVPWVAAPAGRRWLDVGCGTGALLTTVLTTADPAAVVGVDPSAGFVADARARVTDAGARVADCRTGCCVGDARSLPFADRSFDAVVSGLVLNFVPEPQVAVAELARVTEPGGTVAAYVWDYADGMAMMRYFWDCAVALDPAAAALDEGRRFPLCRPEPLARLWAAAGLTAVTVQPIEVPTRFADFDDYWTPFLGGQGPAPGYVASLTEKNRRAVRELVRARLPRGPGGSIPLTARAWAVQGSTSVGARNR